MNANVTKKDVILYFADELDRTRRREIERACQTDPQVKRWFDELTPTDEELDQEPLPEVSVHPRELRSLAATVYLAMEQENSVDDWAEWLRDSVHLKQPLQTMPAEIERSHLYQTPGGTLVYRNDYPRTMSGDNISTNISREIPCIHPDYVKGTLTIRQLPDAVRSGIVDVFAMRRGGNEVEVFPALRVELKLTQRLNGEKYWYADNIPLQSLIGDYQQGDEFIYSVEAAIE